MCTLRHTNAIGMKMIRQKTEVNLSLTIKINTFTPLLINAP